MHTTYLLLGGNLGNREAQLEKAIQLLGQLVGRVEEASSVYETEAWGVRNQPAFLNQITKVVTSLTPAQLLAKIHKIEHLLGRRRREKWHARTIDIDILFYDDVVMATPELTLPHAALHQRRFTLVPLAEIAPKLVHPILKLTSEQMLAACQDSLTVTALKLTPLPV